MHIRTALLGAALALSVTATVGATQASASTRSRSFSDAKRDAPARIDITKGVVSITSNSTVSGQFHVRKLKQVGQFTAIFDRTIDGGTPDDWRILIHRSQGRTLTNLSYASEYGWQAATCSGLHVTWSVGKKSIHVVLQDSCTQWQPGRGTFSAEFASSLKGHHDTTRWIEVS